MRNGHHLTNRTVLGWILSRVDTHLEVIQGGSGRANLDISLLLLILLHVSYGFRLRKDLLLQKLFGTNRVGLLFDVVVLLLGGTGSCKHFVSTLGQTCK